VTFGIYTAGFLVFTLADLSSNTDLVTISRVKHYQFVVRHIDSHYKNNQARI